MQRIIPLSILSVFLASTVFAQDQVPIEASFPTKIVYTTDAAFDTAPLMKDCQERGGTFNECGSVCDDQIKDGTCVTVCAFTCELKAEEPI